MDVVKATSYDYNASKVVTLKDRGKLTKMLNKYSRRKLKQNLAKESEK